MKTIGKKLPAILFVALCCVLIFPITAMADEPAIMPEENELTVRFYLDGMNPAPSKSETTNITIHTDETGHFSFDYPALTILDETMHYYFSGMHVEGEANISDGSGTVKYDNLGEPVSIEKGYYYGDLDVSGLQATLRIDVLNNYGAFEEQQTITFTFERGVYRMFRNGPNNSPCMQFTMYYRVENSLYETGDELRDGSFMLLPIDFIVAGASDEKKGTSDSATTGKWEYYKPEDKQWGFRYNFGGNREKDAEHAGPLSTISISILAILLSILFGNTGGFIPTAPAGTGGAPAPADSGLSRWLRFDGDGDIETTDPVNGQRRTFVNNGDGTYTDPVSGATYTPEELSEQMEHRADNAGTIRQDEEQFERNVREDSFRNQERSDESKQLEKDLQREREERNHKEKVERVATGLGMSGASEDEVREELARRMERDEDFRQKMNDYAKRRDIAVDTLEYTVEVADYAMSAGEALGGAPGKAISATYKGIKNIGATVAEKGFNTGAVIEGAIKGGTEAAGTLMDAGVGKAVTTFTGTVAGEIAEAVNEGEDLTRATMEGFVKGTINTASGAVGDAYGDMVGGDSLLNKAAETAGKIGETGFGKEFADPMYDKMINKDE